MKTKYGLYLALLIAMLLSAMFVLNKHIEKRNGDFEANQNVFVLHDVDYYAIAPLQLHVPDYQKESLPIKLVHRPFLSLELILSYNFSISEKVCFDSLKQKIYFYFDKKRLDVLISIVTSQRNKDIR
jgi:hypothetical protein